MGKTLVTRLAPLGMSVLCSLNLTPPDLVDKKRVPIILSSVEPNSPKPYVSRNVPTYRLN